MEENQNEISTSTQNTEVQETKSVEPAIERNLIAMRKKLEAEEAARKEAERRADEAERRASPTTNSSSSTTGQPSYTDEDESGLDPEDYTQVKYVQKNNKKINSKLSATEQKLAQMEERFAYLEAKAETDTIKDFNEVVNNENIATFARLYPDDHQTVMANPNLRSKAKTMYNMIKNYGISNPALNAVDDKIAKNKLKPGNASSAAPQQPQTPLTRLGDYERRVMTESDRDRIIAEVERKKSIG